MTKKTEPAPAAEGEIPNLPAGTMISVSLREMPAPHGSSPESRFGERARYARNELGFKVEALSRLTREYDALGNGLSPTSIARYESGESLPGVRELRILAESLDVPLNWLIYGDATEAEGRVALSKGEGLFVVALRTMLAERTEDSLMLKQADEVSNLKFVARADKLARARKPSNG